MKSSAVLIWLGILIVCVFGYSCQKESDGSVPPPAPPEKNDIFHKWFLVNIIVYANPDFTGPSFFGYAGNGTEYYDFRTDNKVYTYAVYSFDTAAYKILPDSTMLVYKITKGVQSTKADTAKIKKLTTDSLIFSARNPANEYGKFTFRR